MMAAVHNFCEHGSNNSAETSRYVEDREDRRFFLSKLHIEKLSSVPSV